MTEPLDPDTDLPTIDVRSPGERMVDSGRAGFGRMQQYLRPERLALAAVAWMLAIVVSVGVEIWEVIDLGRQFDGLSVDRWWFKLGLLAQSGDLTLSLATLAGLALVALAGPVRARVGAYLGVVLGAWTVIAGGLGVAVAVHGGAEPISGSFGTNRFQVGLSFAAFAVLGIVVTGIALALAGAGSVDEVS